MHHAGLGHLDGDLDQRDGVVDRADAHTVDGHMAAVGNPQAHRTVDARSGIPAAVGLVLVACDHLEFVGCAELEVLGRIDVEVGVAVGTEVELLAVEPHLGVVVDALELEDGRAALPALGDVEGLGILVVAAHEVADVVGTQAGIAARLGDHRVMGQVDELLTLVAGEAANGPAPVEIDLTHAGLPAIRMGMPQPEGCGIRS